MIRPQDSRDKENFITTFYINWLITNAKVFPLDRQGQPHVYKYKVADRNRGI